MLLVCPSDWLMYIQSLKNKYPPYSYLYNFVSLVLLLKSLGFLSFYYSKEINPLKLQHPMFCYLNQIFLAWRYEMTFLINKKTQRKWNGIA